MSSGRLPAMDQAGASPTPSARYRERFWASHWTWGLINCMTDIPDAMCLQALRPSAAIAKVMSVPDSRCVQVVTPDDHFFMIWKMRTYCV